MRQKNVKMAMCAVTAILAFSSMDIRANAATDLSSVLPSAGVDYTLQANATSLKNIKEEADTEKGIDKQEIEKEGWEVIEANDGRTAWKKFQQTHPDLVILDVDMPELTGLEVAQLILSIDLHTPIVMYSSLTKEQDLQTGLDHGAKCYIIKDYSPATLIRQIKQINDVWKWSQFQDIWDSIYFLQMT